MQFQIIFPEFQMPQGEALFIAVDTGQAYGDKYYALYLFHFILLHRTTKHNVKSSFLHNHMCNG